MAITSFTPSLIFFFLSTSLVFYLFIEPSLSFTASPNEDFFAFPQFETVFKETPVPPPNSSENIVSLPTGGSFFCKLPSTTVYPQNDIESLQDKNRHSSEIISNALQSLEPLKEKCIKLHHEWWTYDFCFGKHAKQYHVAGNTLYLSYILGKHSKNSFPTLESFGRFRYLSFDYDSGTMCDITKQPRTVKIRIQCSLSSTERIESVKETSICNYIMVIRTPKLCKDPFFLASETLLEPRTIDCYPIVSEKDYLDWQQGRSIPLPLPPPKVSMSSYSSKVKFLDTMESNIQQFNPPLADMALQLVQQYIGLNVDPKSSSKLKSKPGVPGLVPEQNIVFFGDNNAAMITVTTSSSKKKKKEEEGEGEGEQKQQQHQKEAKNENTKTKGEEAKQINIQLKDEPLHNQQKEFEKNENEVKNERASSRIVFLNQADLPKKKKKQPSQEQPLGMDLNVEDETGAKNEQEKGNEEIIIDIDDLNEVLSTPPMDPSKSHSDDEDL